MEKTIQDENNIRGQKNSSMAEFKLKIKHVR